MLDLETEGGLTPEQLAEQASHTPFLSALRDWRQRASAKLGRNGAQQHGSARMNQVVRSVWLVAKLGAVKFGISEKTPTREGQTVMHENST